MKINLVSSLVFFTFLCSFNLHASSLDDMEQTIIIKLRELIPQINCLENEASLLDSLPIEISDEGLDQNLTIAAYYDGHIMISQTAMRAAIEDLSIQLIRQKKIPEIIAIHLLPTVGHELRHAWIDQERPGEAPTLEEEADAFALNAQIYEEAKKQFPMAYLHRSYITQSDRIMWRDWRRGGPEALKEFITEVYDPVPISLENENDIKERQKAISKRLAKLDFYEAAVKHEYQNDPEELQQRLDIINEQRKFFREQAAFWSDEERVTQAQEFYKTQEDLSWEQWCEEFPMRCKKHQRLQESKISEQ